MNERDDRGLLAEIKRLDGTDANLLDDEEMLQMILPVIRSDYRAAETYRYSPGPKLTTPVFALVGDDDPKVTVDEARMWRDHTSGPFEIEVFRGGHFYLNAHASTVVDRIRTRLG